MSEFYIRFKIAFRSILRHKTRSMLSIFMISGAVASIIIFRGFSDHMLNVLKEISVENQYGHMQIAKDEYWNPVGEERKDGMFQIESLGKLKQEFTTITSISGRVSFNGLVSNGDNTFGASVIGVDAQKEAQFQKSIKILSGSFFKDDKKEVIVGALLAEQLNVKAGGELTLLTNTVDGMMNAMDVTIVGIYSAGIDEIDSQVLYIPLKTAQNILYTEDVDIGVVRFTSSEEALSLDQAIHASLKATDNTLVQKTWLELARFYKQVKKFLTVQNNSIELILAAIIFLGILNAISMTIVERMGEIGTQRALGETRFGILKQFILESSLISIIGCLIGIVISLAVINIIEIFKVTTEMPGATIPIQIKVIFGFEAMMYAIGLSVITTLVATFVPTMKIVRVEIIEALKKNI